MRKRYVININKSTSSQDKAFVEYLKSSSFGWWHYLSNTWLVVDPIGNSTVSEIRDRVRDIFSNEYNLVIQLNENEGTWAGFGPSVDSKNMFNWIKNNWK